jgi:hypothetical protein
MLTPVAVNSPSSPRSSVVTTLVTRALRRTCMFERSLLGSKYALRRHMHEITMWRIPRRSHRCCIGSSVLGGINLTKRKHETQSKGE